MGHNYTGDTLDNPGDAIAQQPLPVEKQSGHEELTEGDPMERSEILCSEGKELSTALVPKGKSKAVKRILKE